MREKSISEKNISVASNSEDLNVLAEEGLIEKREMSRGRFCYYVEAVEDSMRFGVFIRLREKRIEWILLRWLDRPIKGWDNASEKAMTDEYHLISNFVKKMRELHVIVKKPGRVRCDSSGDSLM
ncbi:hypothetical protein [Massilia sp. DWR3-1-1]|uniref:hypothetical protein n=1 Tax=Massilia sp. DWR3-1-1 TaxID=2804559 RepID=UPI003CEAA601